jgi:hypothetical protein
LGLDKAVVRRLFQPAHRLRGAERHAARFKIAAPDAVLRFGQTGGGGAGEVGKGAIPAPGLAEFEPDAQLRPGRCPAEQAQERMGHDPHTPLGHIPVGGAYPGGARSGGAEPSHRHGSRMPSEAIGMTRLNR